MLLTFYFLISRRVNKYGIFRNNKNTYNLSQNNFHNSQNNVVYFKGVTFISVLIKLRLTCIYWQYTVAVHGCHIAW